MIAGAYLQATAAEEAFDHLRELPDWLRPTHFSSTDARAPKANVLADRSKYARFLAANEAGHTLFSERCTYSFTKKVRSGYSTLFAFPRKEGLSDDDGRSIFGLLGKMLPTFWFSADEKEYDYRNRYVANFGTTTIETWLGRDVSRYVPGLYWMTGLSAELVERCALRGMRGPRGATATTGKANELLICMDGPSADWRRWEVDVSDFCLNQPNIFLLDKIRSELSSATTYKALSAVAERWR